MIGGAAARRCTTSSACVLPAAFARDAERLARFNREARTLASLNHPNIATIHGVEQFEAAGGQGTTSQALLMELVEGEISQPAWPGGRSRPPEEMAS